MRRSLFKFLSILSAHLVMTMGLMSSSYGFGIDDVNGLDFNSKINYNQDDLSVKYGEYSEIEFSVTSNEDLEFSIISEMTPVGMELVEIEGNATILAGTPEFTEKFCFVLSAKSKTSDFATSDRVCLFAEENENIEYPKFLTSMYISKFNKDKYASTRISLTQGSNAEVNFVLGELAQGLDVESQNNSLVIKGTSETSGVFEFLVVAEDTNRGVYTYKQYQLTVDESQNNEYQCDTGYYYDDDLGYCVPNSGKVCPTGEFYDSQSNSCVRYSTPSHITCAPGSYYDHFLYRCVQNNYNRCPYNYEFDGYRNRCVRLPNTCSIGYRYNWNTRSCVYVGYRICRAGSFYSSFYNRCITSYRACRIGNFWNGSNCIRRNYRCNSRNYWDPSSSLCRRRSNIRSCYAGFYFNHGQRSCVRRIRFANRSCRAGSRYSSSVGRCVVYRNHRPTRVIRPTRRRPVVVRRRTRPTHTRVRPVPSRPARPTTRPGTRPTRPTTRPTPTRPTRPTTRPTPTRPTRPTTRPTPSRPSRPTTSRPSRPSRPTTSRPSRPSRPTTSRPSRPSRPTTRPSSGRSSGSRSRSSGSSSRRRRPNG